MAMDPVTAITLFSTAASALGSAKARSQSVAQKESALKLAGQQEKLASQERTLARTEQLDSILSTQTASTAARGLSLASPTFQAIQKSSLNAFAQDQFAENFNLSQREQLFDAEKQDFVDRNRIRLFQDAFSTASTLGSSFSFNQSFGGGSKTPAGGGQ